LENKRKAPMEHLNIGELNKGQSSKLIRELSNSDKKVFEKIFNPHKNQWNAQFD